MGQPVPNHLAFYVAASFSGNAVIATMPLLHIPGGLRAGDVIEWNIGMKVPSPVGSMTTAVYADSVPLTQQFTIGTPASAPDGYCFSYRGVMSLEAGGLGLGSLFAGSDQAQDTGTFQSRWMDSLAELSPGSFDPSTTTAIVLAIQNASAGSIARGLVRWTRPNY